MTCAPWAAASRAASSCLSIIASLSPVQSVWSSAALTMLGIGTPGDRFSGWARRMDRPTERIVMSPPSLDNSPIVTVHSAPCGCARRATSASTPTPPPPASSTPSKPPRRRRPTATATIGASTTGGRHGASPPSIGRMITRRRAARRHPSANGSRALPAPRRVADHRVSEAWRSLAERRRDRDPRPQRHVRARADRAGRTAPLPPGHRGTGALRARPVVGHARPGAAARPRPRSSPASAASR